MEELCNGIDDDCDGEADNGAECVGDEICGEDEGMCLRPCAQGECPEGFICQADRYCHPVPCEPECEEGQICQDQRCLDACIVGRDCLDGQRCENGLCVQNNSGAGGSSGPAVVPVQVVPRVVLDQPAAVVVTAVVSTHRWQNR